MHEFGGLLYLTRMRLFNYYNFDWGIDHAVDLVAALRSGQGP